MACVGRRHLRAAPLPREAARQRGAARERPRRPRRAHTGARPADRTARSARPVRDVKYRTVRVTGTYEPDRRAVCHRRLAGRQAGLPGADPAAHRRRRAARRPRLRGRDRGRDPPGADPGAADRPGDRGRAAVSRRRARPSATACSGTARSPRPTRRRSPSGSGRRSTAPTSPCASRQPGTAGLHVLAGPDLSNPTGGAGEAQLMSYVVQWYVFALLALIGPFALARAEIRDARRRFLGVDDDAVQFDLPPTASAAAASARRRVGRNSRRRSSRSGRSRRRPGRRGGHAPLRAGATAGRPLRPHARPGRGTGRACRPGARPRPGTDLRRRGPQQRQGAAPQRRRVPRRLQRLPVAAGAGRRQHPRRRAARRHGRRTSAASTGTPAPRVIEAGPPMDDAGPTSPTPAVAALRRPAAGYPGPAPAAGRGRLAQRESTRFTPERSLVRSQ